MNSDIQKWSTLRMLEYWGDTGRKSGGGRERGKHGERERRRRDRDSPRQLWKWPDNLKVSASSPSASLWEFPKWLWQWEGEKHLGCSVCSLSSQANSRRFRQMRTRAVLTAGALAAWCDFSLFCAPTFGSWPESGLLVFCRSLRFCIFRFSNKNSSSFPSHLILLALIADGTIIWCGRERIESGSGQRPQSIKGCIGYKALCK